MIAALLAGYSLWLNMFKLVEVVYAEYSDPIKKLLQLASTRYKVNSLNIYIQYVYTVYI